MSRETVNKIIKSCIVSRKGGVPIGEIENDYRELVGEAIPYVSLGYKSLRDFIHSIHFVNVKTNHLGESVLFVSDPKVAHIENLVSKQKNSSSGNAGPNKKRNRRNRYAKSRKGNNKENLNPPPRDPYYENKSRDNYRPDNFKSNKKMEYYRSKWYTDRPKDSWKKNKIEDRKENRYNNFNAGRTSMQSSSNNSTVQNENSWSARTVSPSSFEENMYNFHSLDEKRYAQASRSWRFELHAANNANSTVGKFTGTSNGRSNGRSQQQTYNPPSNGAKCNIFINGQGGGRSNNTSQQQTYNPPSNGAKCNIFINGQGGGRSNNTSQQQTYNPPLNGAKCNIFINGQRGGRSNHTSQQQIYIPPSNGAKCTIIINDQRGGRSNDRSQQQTYNPPSNGAKYHFFFNGQYGGGSTNNSNYGWREWCYNSYPDNQSGLWWPGLQGPANSQFTWMSASTSAPQTYPGYYPWNAEYFSRFPTY